MKNKDMQYICVIGYGWSGSSAVVDLMKEFSGNWDPEVEFRIIKDPHGVMDLEYALLEKWDALNVDIASRDFLDFASFLNQNESKFKRGINYDNVFHGKFMEYTENFIDEISDYRYKSYWWIFNYRMKYSKWLAKKVLNKFIPQEYVENMYFSAVDEKKFYNSVRKYMGKLIDAVAQETECKNIILDQAVPAQHPMKAFDYFNDAKVIVVDRDPRDIYCDLIELRRLIGSDIAVTHDVGKFVKWHKKYREGNQLVNERILRIQFEDLVLHYEDTVNRIVDFVGDDAMTHVQQFEYFDPAISRKNVGKYLNFPYQDEIRVLEQELKDYLYPLEK